MIPVSIDPIAGSNRKLAIFVCERELDVLGEVDHQLTIGVVVAVIRPGAILWVPPHGYVFSDAFMKRVRKRMRDPNGDATMEPVGFRWPVLEDKMDLRLLGLLRLVARELRVDGLDSVQEPERLPGHSRGGAQ